MHGRSRISIDQKISNINHTPHEKPNCKFNVDANSGHAFGILLAAVGALRPCGAPAPVN
jgi:hypothetical protein